MGVKDLIDVAGRPCGTEHNETPGVGHRKTGDYRDDATDLAGRGETAEGPTPTGDNRREAPERRRRNHAPAVRN
jgi:hypothetical protein